MITLVLGGARSGKSAVAEQLAGRLTAPITYIATALVAPDDADHVARIEAHRARRDASWCTIETGPRLPEALRATSGSVLVDSLGTWMTTRPDFLVDAADLCDALTTRAGSSILVSEEVGLGVHPSSDMGRRFRDALGDLNAAVAAVSDEVLLVIAGRVLPLEPP